MKGKKSLYFFLSLSFVIAFLIFMQIIRLDIRTDIQIHSGILVGFIQKNSFPIPPLYYFCIYILSGFRLGWYFTNEAAVVILTFSVTLKFYFSHQTFNHFSKKHTQNSFFYALTAFLLLFTMPVFYDVIRKYMYLGRLAPNVWHNSTTIFVMPFVILLFVQSLKFIEHKGISKKAFFLMCFAGLINLLTKPSFLFVFIPIFPLVVFFKNGFFSKKFFLALSLASVLFLGIILEYYIIYILDLLNVIYENDNSGIAIKPFKFWKIYSNNILLDIFVSLVFPLTYIILFFKEFKTNFPLQYAIYLLLFAVFLGIIFIEKGAKASHGNFFWQVVMTTYLLFLVSAVFALEKVMLLGYKHQKSILLILTFGLHLGSGFLYLFKIFYTGSYT